MIAVFKKEVSAYFSTPFGFVFMGIFLLISGIVFTTYNLAGQRSDIYGMLGILSNISITIFPVLTMKLLAEERKLGTDQILLTSSLSVADIVIGKYLAALFVFFMTLLSTGVYVVILFVYGEPTVGTILGAYVGFFLLGATFIAICLFASSFTENQVIAAVSGIGVLFGLVIIGSLSKIVSMPILKDIITYLAITKQYEVFTRGVFSLGPLVYYISFAIAFIFLTIQSVEQRRWTQGG